MIPFEVWLNNNQPSFSEDALGLFQDSLRCYKNNIIRPAFLLAYQGMLITLRNKILYGTIPTGYGEAEWKSICSAICDDRSWDENTYDRVVQKGKGGKAPILCMSDFVRDQFKYWRHLRNVCAHYKEFVFLPAHVVTLYAFIESNLMKISVEGGTVSLLEELKDFCNPAKYTQTTPLTPIVSKITEMVPTNELEDFVDNAIKIVARCHHRNLHQFILDLLLLDGEANSRIREVTRDNIKKDIISLNSFLDCYPELISQILTDAVEVREYWHRGFGISSNPHKIASSLLANGMIPKDQQEELFAVLLGISYPKKVYLQGLSNAELQILRNAGYFDHFYHRYFNKYYIKNKYSEVCYKTDFYIEHIRLIDLNKDLVERMIDLFSCTPFPYTLRDRIRDELWSDPKFKTEFERIAIENNIAIPTNFLQ